MRVRFVADQLEILETEGEQILHLGVELHGRQRQRLAGQLQVGLFQVVGVKVAVTARPDELAGLQAADLRDHQRQERIAGDVERHTQEVFAPQVVLTTLKPETSKQFPDM